MSKGNEYSRLFVCSKVFLIGLVVGVMLFGYLFAQNEIKESGWPLRDLSENAKLTATYFLDAYYNNATPIGQGLKFWIVAVRQNTFWLRRLGDMRVIEPFIAILRDTIQFNDEIHSCIAVALGNLGDTRAIPILKECLNRKSDLLRMTSAIALCLLGEAKIGLPTVEEYGRKKEIPFSGMVPADPVNSFLTWDNKPVKLKKDNELLIKYMERALKFPRPILRINAAYWLIKQNKKKYTSSALEVASEILLNEAEQRGNRSHAIFLLKEIRNNPAKEELKKVLNDEDKWIANDAKDALKEIEKKR